MAGMYSNLDGFQRHWGERTKSHKVTDGMIPLITFSKIQDDSDGEQSRGCQRLGGGYDYERAVVV